MHNSLIQKIFFIALIGINMAPSQLSGDTQTIILAAGKSSRFKTKKSKLLHTLCGKEMILYPVKALDPIPTTLVVGHQAEDVKQTVLKHFPTATFVVQHEQKGTGHALACTRKMWNKKTVIVLNGDMPLITHDIIQNLLQTHHSSNVAVTFAVSNTSDPGARGFGRVIKENGKVKIIEVKHLTGNLDDYPIVNVGIYVFDIAFLHEAIDKLEQHSLTQEFYITDLVEIANNIGKKVSVMEVPFDKVRGVNTVEEFSMVQAVKRKELVRHWMQQGVIFTHPETIELDYNVNIGSGTYIGQGVHIRNKTSIGKNCIIEPFALVHKSTIGDDSHIMSHTIISGMKIDTNASIPPYTFLSDRKSS